MIRAKNIPASLRKKGLNARLTKLCEENDVVFMAIFGSFVRGEEKKRSDVDMLFRYRKGSRKSLLDLVGLEEELSLVFGRKVDLLTIESISPYIREQVLNSMKVIYECAKGS